MLSPSRKTCPVRNFIIWSRMRICLESPVPASPRKMALTSRPWAKAKPENTRTSSAVRRAAAETMAGSAFLGHLDARQLVVEVDRRLHAFLQVAEVQALVLGVRVAQRVFDTHEQAGRAAQRVRERLHEPD